MYGWLQNHLLDMDAKRAVAPTWATIRYMVSAIQYGGRITDEFDKLLMDTYAEKYFQQVLAPHARHEIFLVSPPLRHQSCSGVPKALLESP
jgi:hypothetical protein